MNNLNPKLFSTQSGSASGENNIEQIPIRQGYGEGLLQAGQEDERVVALCADLTGSTKTNIFSDKFPERFVQVGIGEQSMASVASGMSAMGKIPFFASYAMFSPGRNWEQIRTTICYNNSNVKVVGAHAGVSVGPDGGTHQAIEDMAIMRTIPNMTVIAPCDYLEAKKATLAAAKMIGPVYIRLAREKTPVMTTEETSFEIGKAQVFFTPRAALGDEKKVGIIACGALVYQSIMAAKELEEEGIAVGVMNLATIKPIDKDGVVNFSKEYGRIVTVEEHQVHGGMGSAVAELLSKENPTQMEFVGVQDQFGQSGEPNELIKYYGMDKDSIKKAVKNILE